MHFGSLFTGIGGFDLALERAGMVCDWQVEIDKNCQKLLAHRFPNARRYTDVRDVGKHNLSAVDVICGGFPCQDLSVAGKRVGLAGERSGLWYEFARIIDEMRPGIVIIENVPGLLSSAKGADFGIIVSTLDEFGYGVAWRMLDAQHFGLAQRRKRIFIISSLGSGRAAEILFEPESVCWDSAQSREEGQGITAYSPSGFGGYGEQPGTLRANGGDLGGGSEVLVSSPLLSRGYKGVNAESISQLITVGALQARDGKGIGSTIDDKIVLALTPDASNNINGSKKSQEITRMAGAVVGAQIWEMQHASEAYRESGEVAPTLQARMGTGGNNIPLVGVRKLTPTECERLQGFPDGWTASFADSIRYKMLGNAVAVPVAEWIARRIAALEAV